MCRGVVSQNCGPALDRTRRFDSTSPHWQHNSTGDATFLLHSCFHLHLLAGVLLLNSTRQVCSTAIVLLCLLALTGCGGSSSTAITQQQITVNIPNASCAASTTQPCPIGVGANWQLSATVTGSSNQSVTWSLSPSGASSGTIDSNGIYIAPNTVPNPATVTITATSAPDTAATASLQVTVLPSDPLGTVSSSSQLSSCAGSVSGGTCYQLAISCPQVNDFSVYLKVNNPPVAPVGTVLLGVGTGGSGLYDDPTAGGYEFGSNVVTSLLSSGYNTVQVSFGAPFDKDATPRGWLTGPGGVRRLACRYATVADWVYHNPTMINSNVSAGNSVPMCATGNSGGSAVIAYAVYEYGLDTEFKMIEPTSGPVMTRLDQGCSPPGTVFLNACTGAQQDMVYSTGGAAGGDAAIIDEAYQSAGATTPTPCTDAINGTAAPAGLFLSDSILYRGSQIVNLPNLNMKQLFGDTDTSNAVPQGTFWNQFVSPTPALQCLPGVAHDIPSFTTGAQQIANDIVAGCH